MPRRARSVLAAEWFHLCNRGADRQDVFGTDHDRHAFEALLADAVDEFDIEVHGYALMTNHFHLLVRVGSIGAMSRALRAVQGRYASGYNVRNGRTGPLFESRFTSIPIVPDPDDDGIERQALTTLRYVHRNPLVITGSAALAAYRWSSLGPYLGRRTSPSWLTLDVLASATDMGRHLAAVLEPQPADALPVGDLPPLRPTSLDELDRAVSMVTGAGADRSTVPGISREDERAARMLAVTLARELRVADDSTISDRFGLRRDSVRQVARRGRVRISTDEEFAHRRERVLAALVRGAATAPPRLLTGVSRIDTSPM